MRGEGDGPTMLDRMVATVETSLPALQPSLPPLFGLRKERRPRSAHSPELQFFATNCFVPEKSSKYSPTISTSNFGGSAR